MIPQEICRKLEWTKGATMLQSGRRRTNHNEGGGVIPLLKYGVPLAVVVMIGCGQASTVEPIPEATATATTLPRPTSTIVVRPIPTIVPTKTPFPYANYLRGDNVERVSGTVTELNSRREGLIFIPAGGFNSRRVICLPVINWWEAKPFLEVWSDITVRMVPNGPYLGPDIRQARCIVERIGSHRVG